MSTHYLTSVQSPEIARQQGLQPSPRSPQADRAQNIERNESTAEGQKLPPDGAKETDNDTFMESVVSRISDFVQNFQRDLHFTVDKDSGRTVIKVIDSETEELIRQIPAEETLRIARSLDSPESLILREQA